MSSMPTDSELEVAVKEILRDANVEQMSLKIIRKKLETRFSVSVVPHSSTAVQTASTAVQQ